MKARLSSRQRPEDAAAGDDRRVMRLPARGAGHPAGYSGLGDLRGDPWVTSGLRADRAVTPHRP